MKQTEIELTVTVNLSYNFTPGDMPHDDSFRCWVTAQDAIEAITQSIESQEDKIFEHLENELQDVYVEKLEQQEFDRERMIIP